MKTLVLADIHANYPALSAVLNDAPKFDQVLFLGDLANFGPHPSECVECLMSLNPLCIMGNHDAQIASNNPKNFWDKWAHQKLTPTQREWIGGFQPSVILDNHILVLHGVYSVDYDILPNTPDDDIENAFKDSIKLGIDEVWFGHYHYDMTRTINGITYRCIRPVGHHRDKDIRASYYLYEDNILTHRKVNYEINKTIVDLESSDIFADELSCQSFVELVRNAYHEKILAKDIRTMQENERRNKLNIQATSNLD